MDRALHAVEELRIPKERCATFHSSLGVGAIGTTGSYDSFLCVEIPLPWSRDISMDEPFLTLFGAGTASFVAPDGRSVRPQGVVPGPGAEGWTRVMSHDRPTASGAGGEVGGPYRRREWWVHPDEVLELCRALVDGDERAAMRHDERLVEVDDDVVDLFVCTHGKRDACCGSMGAVLHDRLADRLAVIDPERRRMRLWRVSHTGGHRFAPTALTFPDGYAWAHLDAEQALGLALRAIEPAVLRGHCRGVASLRGAPSQAADGAALAEVGWEWARAERLATVIGFDRRSLRTEVRIEGRWDDSRVAAFRVGVELERHVPQITCGDIDAPEYAVEPVWRATSIVPV